MIRSRRRPPAPRAWPHDPERAARALVLGGQPGEDAELDRALVSMAVSVEYHHVVVHHVRRVRRRRRELEATWPALCVQGLVLALVLMLWAVLA